MKKQITERFEYDGLGFPIVLLNVSMRTIRGEEVPDIDYNVLQRVVMENLSHKPVPLSGNEIRFIRQYLRMTLVEFAKHFGVTHAAVIKWEKTGNNLAKITPSTELYIRLYILEHMKVNNKMFRNTFTAFDQNEKLKGFDKSPPKRTKPLTIESRRVCA